MYKYDVTNYKSKKYLFSGSVVVNLKMIEEDFEILTSPEMFIFTNYTINKKDITVSGIKLRVTNLKLKTQEVI